MGFLAKFIAKIVLNGAALWVASIYFPGFVMIGGLITIVIGGAFLAVLNLFLRPILRLISAPLVWITFGLFNFVINMFILWLADRLLTQIAITDLTTLFWVSVILSLANAFF
ncbi:MAG: phage holin family protein [Candidatus Sungbacteria bacterium]|nr:phage holin family protein [Candidatus Sungbacteria bacterium]